MNKAIHMWFWPTMHGLLSAFGIGLALTMDGIGNLLSWLALGTPLLTLIYVLLRTYARAHQTPRDIQTLQTKGHHSAFGSKYALEPTAQTIRHKAQRPDTQ